MTFHVENFRGQILSRATEGKSLVLFALEKLGQTKICQRNVAIRVHEHIFRLQISVHDRVCVEIAKSAHYLGSNKFDGSFLESLTGENVVINVTSRQVFKEEIDAEFVLKDEVHRVYKRMVRLEQDFLLILNISHLFLLQQQVFIDSFHCIDGA